MYLIQTLVLFKFSDLLTEWLKQSLLLLLIALDRHWKRGGGEVLPTHNSKAG